MVAVIMVVRCQDFTFIRLKKNVMFLYVSYLLLQKKYVPGTTEGEDVVYLPCISSEFCCLMHWENLEIRVWQCGHLGLGCSKQQGDYCVPDM